MDFWNAAVSDTVADVVADPADAATFAGRLRWLDLGAIRMAEIFGGASTVTRHPSRAREQFFVLQLLLSGEIVCRSRRAETSLHPGDFWIYDPACPSQLLLPEPAAVLVLRIPRAQMQPYIACPEALASRAVSAGSTAGALVSRFLQDLWSSCQDVGFAELAPRFTGIALQMIGSAYAALPEAKADRSSLTMRHRVRIRRHIEERLCEPDLTPSSIAAALHITPGYLHRLFSGDDEPVARYILRRRLEECHRALCDRMQAGASVTSIAFAHGFNSLAHFCRVFRDRYGLTPRELQRSPVDGH